MDTARENQQKKQAVQGEQSPAIQGTLLLLLTARLGGAGALYKAQGCSIPTLLRCLSSTSIALGLMLLLHPSSREIIRAESRAVILYPVRQTLCLFFPLVFCLPRTKKEKKKRKASKSEKNMPTQRLINLKFTHCFRRGVFPVDVSWA